MKEIFKDIKGYEGLYQISNLGRIKSFSKKGGYNKEIFLKQSNDTSGYKQVCLTKNYNKKSFAIHRLVARHFMLNKNNKPQINHIDGNKQNNYINNLEFVTALENKKHASRLGLIAQGEKHHSAKLKEKDVVKIRSLIKDFKNTKLKKMMAKKYVVSIFAINDILKIRTWKHV